MWGLTKKVEFEISPEEALSGKWKNTFCSGGKYTVNALVDENGNPLSSNFTEKYCKEHKLGKYGEKADDVKAKKARKAEKANGKKKGNCGCCCLCRCLMKIFCYFLPFGVDAYVNSDDE